MSILTTCAACAKALEHDAPTHCVNCQTRYCSDRCHRYDRRRGGHGKICGAIASGGGAEQHHANQKYDEAVADAVEICADDNKDDGATLDDLREAVEIFEDIERTSRRLLGAAHPRVFDIEWNLKSARAALRPREDA